MKIHLWNILFLLGFIAYVIIRGVFGQRSKGNEAVSWSDRRELILMVIMAI